MINLMSPISVYSDVMLIFSYQKILEQINYLLNLRLWFILDSLPAIRDFASIASQMGKFSLVLLPYLTKPIFHTDPPSSPPSKPEVPDVPDQDTEHPLHTQGNPPVPLPQWRNEDAPRCDMRQQMVKSHPDSVYGNRTLVDLQ